jgi:hypothetical protein
MRNLAIREGEIYTNLDRAFSTEDHEKDKSQWASDVKGKTRYSRGTPTQPERTKVAAAKFNVE